MLNVLGKFKDDISARLNRLQMEIQTKLAPIKKGKRKYLPPATHTLSRKEKIVFCKFQFKSTHHCHVIMKDLLPSI